MGPSVNRGDCVAGIKKADEAISDCSRDEEYEDLRCSLQLKRAKLLKILVSCMLVAHVWNALLTAVYT